MLVLATFSENAAGERVKHQPVYVRVRKRVIKHEKKI